MSKSKIENRSNIFLKICNSNMVSYGGFTWKKSGIIKCLDFKQNGQCGNGLHAFLPYSSTDFSVSNVQTSGFKPPIFMAVEAIGPVNYLSDGKVKFEKCRVIKTYKDFTKACSDIANMRAGKNVNNIVTNHYFTVSKDIKKIGGGYHRLDLDIIDKMHVRLYDNCFYKIRAYNSIIILNGNVEIERCEKTILTSEPYSCCIKNSSGKPIKVNNIEIPANRNIYRIDYTGNLINYSKR